MKDYIIDPMIFSVLIVWFIILVLFILYLTEKTKNEIIEYIDEKLKNQTP